MSKPSEKKLDAALDTAFKNQPEFVQWFLERTRFSGRGAKYLWSRSDHPWGTIDYTSINPETGLTETTRKECETDVLVVLKAEDGEILALHIENKIASGKFTALQPELYRPRAEQWKDNPKYQNYSDFQTILVAPKVFYDRSRTQADLFDCFITHEDIARFIPLFGTVENDV